MLYLSDSDFRLYRSVGSADSIGREVFVWPGFQGVVMSPGHELEMVERGQCLDLLQTVRVGRLVFTEQALPAVQPVNFRLWHSDIVIRISGGAKLAAAVGNHVVAFEADDLDADLRTGWSVTVVGHAQLITDVGDLVELSGTFLQPWVEGRHDYFVRIRTEQVTGRRLGASAACA